ncbi:MAG: Metallo-dependent phosphatase-like protein [Podila humilis]|nr:MAG: Metallo-dependent phosphatase-like protein [Podila humilis]
MASMDCGACVSALAITKHFDRRNRQGVLNAFKKLCPSIKKQTPDVHADINGDDGKLICYGLYGKCPAPPLPESALRFPKPRPVNPTALHTVANLLMCFTCPTGMLTKIIQLEQRPSVTVRSVVAITKANFTILTGDIPAHDTWLGTIESTKEVEHTAYKTMSRLPSKIYPTIGNHESFPASLFNTPSTGSDKWLYDSLADEWSRWLPADSLASARHYGAYSVSPAAGLRIISLNTNFCYKQSFFNYANSDDTDPFVGPVNTKKSSSATRPTWLRNSSLDTHYDDFALYYAADGVKSAENAISTAWVGPSVTPLGNLNSGFRVYKVDTKSWNVFDSLTYVADISKGSEWDATGATPDWHLEYSARAAFGPYAPIADNKALSPSWWYEVATAFEKDDAAFQKFWLYRSKSSGRIGACPADGACPSEIICQLKNGNGAETCPKHFGDLSP